ncbi:MAG: hypothetical protein H0X30_03305 [Anaerolineae bacterium]|nr:hypothetical protein [Anaerolineae bacterium]
MPALQVEQVKRGCFEAIYEDNACTFKPNSNDQKRKSMVEFLFLKSSQNPISWQMGSQDTFQERIASLFSPLICDFFGVKIPKVEAFQDQEVFRIPIAYDKPHYCFECTDFPNATFQTASTSFTTRLSTI